ncbi:MAG: DegT/DnrJ/EryC1/StrS family aminotransferase [Candidatus Omnitrophica bacterium]|nr:DegT/DnrJ/EryC1/StrS family aminotransferase [Candidatus Omnitrophota bacterium]
MKERLFIHGGKKTREKRFDYSAPIGDEEIASVNKVLRKKSLSGFYKDFLGGEMVQKFEKDFAKYIGTRYAIVFNSGTSALHAALAACNIGPGDEVIVPPFTFTATASSVLMVGAATVFADIEPDTFCIDPKKIKAAITKKTKAIVPVHIYGKVCNMDEILAIAKEDSLKVIEDACQSPGCKHEGRMVGSIGDAGVFSFVETKNMVIGEGGMVTTNSDEIADRCRLIRNHGEVWTKGRPREYISNILGYNFRMTEIHAALGIEQLKKLDSLNEIRRKNVSYLQKELGRFSGLEVMRYKEGEISHLYPILYNEREIGVAKDRFIELMESEGITLSRGYPQPLYKTPIFKEKLKEAGFGGIKCRVAEDVCRRLICITAMHYPYNIEDMKDIVSAVKKIFDNIGEIRP